MTARTSSRHLDRWDALALALLGGTIVVTAALYGRLPERVPVHFDIHGNADNFASRPFGAWILVACTIFTWCIVRLGALLLPHDWRVRLERSPTSILGMTLVALFCSLQIVILYAAMRPGDSMGRPLAFALSAFWIVLGLMLPRVRRNPFIGVRTTWTLTSDENWARTHRIAGFAFTIGGIVGLFGAAVGSHATAIVAILLSGLVPVLYSYVLARKLTH